MNPKPSPLSAPTSRISTVGLLRFIVFMFAVGLTNTVASMPRAEEALARLRAEREPAFTPEPAAERGALERAPGFSLDGLLIRRGTWGGMRRIYGVPYLVEPPQGFERSETEALARAFLSEWADLWGLGERDVELALEFVRHGTRGGVRVAFRQLYRGVPVERVRIVVHLDAERRLYGVNGEYVPGIVDPVEPSLDATELLDASYDASARFVGVPRLVIYSPSEFGAEGAWPVLAWRMAIDPGSAASEPVLRSYDAHTGQMLHEEPLHPRATDIEIYDCAGATDYASCTLRYRTDPYYHNNCAVAGTDCWNALFYTLSLLNVWTTRFGRDGYDDTSETDVMRAYYDRGTTACNAGGTGGIDYEGPDPPSSGRIYRTWYDPGVVRDSDMVAHEFGHALWDWEHGGDHSHSDQSGAVNEHFADLHDMWGESDWLLSNDDPGCSWIWRRYDEPPLAPGTGGGPDSWAWFELAEDDDGRVHHNNGILNKMAYLLHDTGTNNHHGVAVTGLGKSDASWLFYHALNGGYLSAGGDIHDYRDGLVTACAQWFGATSNQCVQLDNAWNAVGLWAPEENPNGGGWIDTRPAAISWQGWGGYHWLYVFYKNSQGQLVWRWVNGESGFWGSEQVVQTENGGHIPVTDQPVTVTPWSSVLYIFYKVSGSEDINYVYMDTNEEFWGPFSIPSALAQTDRGPTAVAETLRGQIVVFKEDGSNDLTSVYRSRYSGWQALWTLPSMLETDDSPYATTFTATGDEFFVVVKSPDASIAYGICDSYSGCYPTTSLPGGARQYDPDPPPGGWDYVVDTSFGPSATEWQNDVVVAHRGHDGNHALWTHVFGVPRHVGDHVWGPMVRKPGGATSTPTVVVAHTLGGTPHALWMIHQGNGNNNIWWTRTRGGQ